MIAVANVLAGMNEGGGWGRMSGEESEEQRELKLTNIQAESKA